MLYYCNDCFICTSNLSDYNKHLKTNKHRNKVQNQDKASIYIKKHINQNKREPNENITLHVSNASTNHDNKETNKLKNKNKQCKYCGVCYAYLSGLSRHMKTCSSMITEQPQTSQNDAKVMNMMNIFLQETVACKQMFADVVKNTTELIKTNHDLIANQQATTEKVFELYKNNAASVTNNIYNHKGDNNHFSINVFLNETCKDAMNITDFVNSIELSREDMENVGRNGYVKGISSIFIENLKNTEVHKRPIHCSDRKREVLYVKDSDKWEREGVDSQKLKDAVRVVEQKNIGMVNEWAKQHPDCEKSDTRANDLYMKLSRCVLDGEDENIVKVVKNIAKETVIERNILLVE